MRALIVEDDGGSRRLAEAVLRRGGHEVISHATAEAALEAAVQGAFDIAVVDWMLPGMDGVELCRRLRTLPWGSDAFLLVVTARDDYQDIHAALEAGVDDYLVKPVDPEVLDRRLVIAQHQLGKLRGRQRIEAEQRQVHEQLETMVEQRTRELEAANRRLRIELAELAAAQAELRRLEALHTDVLNSMNDGLLLTDTEGRMLFANRAAVEMFGYTLDEMIGSEWTRTLPPDQLSVLQAAWSRRAQGKSDRYEIEVQSVTGERVPVEVTGTPRFENGRLVGSVGVFRDLRERRRSEAEKALLSAAIEQTLDSVAITDTEGIIRYVNPAFERTTGYSASEVLGRHIKFLRSHEQDPEVLRSMVATLAAGQSWSGELLNQRADGTVYEENVVVFPVHDATGKIENHVCAFRDVSEQRKLQRQLAQAQKMEALGQLAGGVAHDFNNINQVVLGSAELLKRRLPEDHPARHEVEVILRTARSSSQMTRALLDFSRQQPLVPADLDLDKMVADNLGLLRRLLPENFTITHLRSAKLDNVAADRNRLEQVLVNLCVNARDAMPQGGTIVIATGNREIGEEFVRKHPWAQPGPYVWLEVRDTGVGMDEQTLSRLFSPFFTTKAPGKGTGLGLASAYGVVKQHNGLVDVTSSPGVGTTVTVYLPRAEPSAVSVEEPEPIQVEGRERVLVVEDHPDLRQVMVRYLEVLGYEATSAADGLEALTLLKNGEPKVDLVVTDVTMPRMGGLELYRHAHELAPQLPFLFCTGYAPDWSALDELGNARIGQISKPFALDALGRKLRELLSPPS